MNTSIINNSTVSKQQVNFERGVYSANGVRVTCQKINTTGTTYKDYCPKCGKPKSSHKFLQGCPK